MTVTTMPRSRSLPKSRLVAAGSFVLLLAVVVATLASSASVVSAQDSSALVLRRVDTVQPAQSFLQFVYTGSSSDATGAQLSENGSGVAPTETRPLPAATPMAVALIFDTAAAMDTSGALVEAKDAAKQWVRSRSGSQLDSQVFAVYAASDTAVQIQGYTSDTSRIVEAIDRVAPPATEAAREKSALWSAIRQAANGLDERNAQPNIVVMTGTNDSVSGASERSGASGAVRSSGAAIFAAELTGAGLSTQSLDALVKASGGFVLTTGEGSQFGQLVDDMGTAIGSQQYETRFASTVDLGSIADFQLQVGGQTRPASVVVGSDVQGAEALNPTVIPASGGVTFLQGNLGLLLLIVVALFAVGMLAYAVFMLFVRDDRLATVLSPYDTTTGGTDADGEDKSMARTAIMQRAVQITEQVAQDRGVLVRVENALERANLPLRAAEALLFYAAIVVLVTVAALALSGSLLIGLILGVLAALAPVSTVNFLAARRRKRFMSLLPDTLSLLSGTLRAGYSLMQGVEAVSDEVSEPMGFELRRVVTEARLGRPLEEALDGTAERMASADFAWAVMAIRIQREVGGNLAELLMTVSETMVERERLRRDVQTLTAEGRVSAFVLLMLPVGLGGIMFVINPTYTGQLIETTVGNIMLGVALLSMLIGFAWMRKIINIEI